MVGRSSAERGSAHNPIEGRAVTGVCWATATRRGEAGEGRGSKAESLIVDGHSSTAISNEDENFRANGTVAKEFGGWESLPAFRSWQNAGGADGFRAAPSGRYISRARD